jgi:tetratricopeptide (TPR) repeat protein
MAGKGLKTRKIKKYPVAVGVAGLFLALIIIGGGVAALNFYQKNQARYELARRIADYGPRKGVPQTIEDLRNAIAAYEDLIEQHVRDAAQTSAYWKILATRFRDRGMHIEAMEALEHALRYSPDEETLHYLLGLSAGQAAGSVYGAGETARLLAEAEKAYLRAIALAEGYTQARYALAVLYVFELERPADALPQLERYMELRSGDADAMFIMARALYMLGRYREAVDWYGQGIPYTKDAAKIAEAEANMRFIRENL